MFNFFAFRQKGGTKFLKRFLIVNVFLYNVFTRMFQREARRYSTVQTAVLAGVEAVLAGTRGAVDPGTVDTGPLQTLSMVDTAPPGPLQALSERLIAAARRGDMEAVAVLIDSKQVSVDVADSTGLTAILAASVRIRGFIVGAWKGVGEGEPSPPFQKFSEKFDVHICRFWCTLTAIKSFVLADEYAYF